MGRSGSMTSVPPPPNTDHSTTRREWVYFLFAFLILLVVLLIVIAKRRFIRAASDVPEVAPASESPKKPTKDNGLWGHSGDITFCDGKQRGLYNLRFILKSSVEMLGKGRLGPTYKLILRDGSIVALKRLKEVNMKRKEFEQHMMKLGNLRMENIVPVQSYYYSKGLNFLVYDYYCLGSVSSLLQGGRRRKHTPLDWPTRISIAIDVARGLRHLHKNNIAHGNLKSTNIFLNKDFKTLVSECSLVQMASETLAERATMGYRDANLEEITIPTAKSDVYSYGVFVMELLTGKQPSSDQVSTPSSSSNSAMETIEQSIYEDLPDWVQKTMRNKSCVEDVFDLELRPTLNFFKAAGIQMLMVAKACVSAVPESRPCMEQVLKMMKNIKADRKSLFGDQLVTVNSDFEDSLSISLESS